MIENIGDIMKSKNKKNKKLQTTKILTAILMIFILFNCIAVESYSMYVMYKLGNLEALSALITTAIGSCFTLVLEFAVYCAKSFFETKAEKELEFKREQLQMSQDDIDEADFSEFEG